MDAPAASAIVAGLTESVTVGSDKANALTRPASPPPPQSSCCKDPIATIVPSSLSETEYPLSSLFAFPSISGPNCVHAVPFH